MAFQKRANEAEHRAYGLFARAGIPIPKMLGYDESTGVLRLEDLQETHASGWERDELMIDMAASLHAAFWDNYDAFGEIGLPWRLDNPKNFARHCKAMEKGIKPYCKAHTMDGEVFRQALAYLCDEMPKLMEGRLHAGKNITILHGDLHPGNVLLPTNDGDGAVFVDLEAVRMGLAAEDLAMLLGLHIAPERERALPLLERWHQGLNMQGYAFETLLEDYRAALAEGLFFPVKLWLSGIDATHMVEKAIKAWKGFASSL